MFSRCTERSGMGEADKRSQKKMPRQSQLGLDEPPGAGKLVRL